MGSYKYEELNKTDTSWVYNSEYGNYPISYNYSTYWKPKYSIDSGEGEVKIKFMNFLKIFFFYFFRFYSNNFFLKKIFLIKKTGFSINNSAT